MNARRDFEVLPGLPPFGALPLQFSDTGMGMHTEGLVVRFLAGTADDWVGNFQPGLSHFSRVVGHPDGKHLFVIAGGSAYVVDPVARKLVDTFGAQIEFAQELPDHRAVLFGNGLCFELHNEQGLSWRSRRVSWDGIKDVIVSAAHITGLGWCIDDTWPAFEIDLATGAVRGGAYTGPD